MKVFFIFLTMNSSYTVELLKPARKILHNNGTFLAFEIKRDDFSITLLTYDFSL